MILKDLDLKVILAMSNDNSIKGGEFSLNKMKEILGNHTDKRISEDAAKELRLLLENYGREITEQANEIANSDGRMTVRDSDIVAALRNRGDL